MSTYTLSVVQLCPDAYAASADAIAEASGYGPGNLSVRLGHADGSTWWGCHAWWIPEVLAAAVNPPDEIPGTADILQHVITSVVYTEGMSDAELSEVALQHWLSALSASGLTVVEPAE